MPIMDNYQNLVDNNIPEPEITPETKPNSSDLVQRIKTSLYKQERTRTWKFIQRMRQETNFAKLLDRVVAMVRQELKATRVFVYQFHNDTQGIAIAEAVTSEEASIINEIVSCDYFGQATASHYRKQGFVIVEREPNQDFESADKLIAQASLAMPILSNTNSASSVWGLLVVQQESSRQWQEDEINLLDRITVELTLALQTARPFLAFGQQSDLANKVNQDIQKSITERLQLISNSLKVERTLVYGYHPDGSGKVLAEVIDGQWKPAGSTLEKDYFLPDHYQPYYAVDDVATKKLSLCFQEQLDALEVEAYITVPIVHNQQLIGLLSVFQHSHPRNWQESEVRLLQEYAHNLSSPVQQTAAMRNTQFQLQQKNKTIELEKGLTKMLERIRSSEKKETIWQIATQEGRKLMEVDRLAIYRFEPDWSGKFIAESVAGGWSKLIDTMLVVQDTYLQETQGGRYKHGECFAVEDIYTIGHQDCHLELLEQFEARAYAIAPIFGANKKLWGLVGAYHNQGSHKWQLEETAALRQIGLQIGIAMEQIEYIEELKEKNVRESAIINFSGQLVSRLAGLSRTSFDVDSLLNSTIEELRQVLKADRVGICQFHTDGGGEFKIESVDAKWNAVVGTDLAQVDRTYFQKNQGSYYVQGESLAVNNIDRADRSPRHLELLEKWETKAYVIAPIFLEDKLWGLLGVYQNDAPREWKTSETAIIEQVSTQIGIILQLTEYVTKLRTQEQELTTAADRERAKREQLQQGALRVLRALQPSFQGDLTVRAPLSEDEIGTIADGYNTTIQSLRELVRQVQISATKVSDTSGNNTSSVTELSDQAQQQVDRLGTALSELQLMIQCTEEVTMNAEKVGQAVREANRTVQNGDSLMEQTVDSILEVRDTVSETAKKVKRLGEASQKISKVVNLIDNFATQTNLLSLNAAIEATRAGEYGKGFAVVADEVRTLAYQSANATTEIERLVAEIQTEIGEVTAVMEVGIAQVVQGSELVDETRQSLSEIVAVTNEISGLVAGITEATKIQNKQSQTLTEAMTDVSTLANKTFANSTQISQSFQELLTTSEELQTSVSRFKVD